MKSYVVTIQMKATEQYRSCDAVYYAVQGGFIFWSVDAILWRDHSNEIASSTFIYKMKFGIFLSF